MLRNFISLFLILGFISCSKHDHTSNSPAIYYQYGSSGLPGNLPLLDGSYRPANLSSKVISTGGKTYAPMNIQGQTLTLTFDVQTQTVTGSTHISFEMDARGIPYFELSGTIFSTDVDQVPLTPATVTDPDLGQSFWALDAGELDPGVSHELVVNYQLPQGRVTFANGGVRALASMTDVSGAHFFENWAPVTFEDDPFELELILKVMNGTSTHQLYTNGTASEINSSEWHIEFPGHFTKSSFYLHLTNSYLPGRKFTYQGMEKAIPVTVYSSRSDLVDQAVEILPSLFAEFENDYGPYAHDSFIAYMNPSGGGMEYVGAAITSLGALDHELFHSWFARGIMPAEGRSGWIDEAMASWRDYGYFQAPSLLQRTPTNLANYSPFRKSTASNCYVDGRQLMAELDRVFADYGGMKSLMRAFFARYQKKVVTTEEFWNFLNAMTDKNVDLFFLRYSMGQPEAQATSAHSLQSFGESPDNLHPPQLTEDEELQLR